MRTVTQIRSAFGHYDELDRFKKKKNLLLIVTGATAPLDGAITTHAASRGSRVSFFSV